MMHYRPKIHLSRLETRVIVIKEEFHDVGVYIKGCELVVATLDPTEHAVICSKASL